MADPTRLELATSAVTGQRSNQLSYESTIGIIAYFVGKSKYLVLRRVRAGDLEGAGVSSLRLVDLILHGRLGS